MNMPVCQKLQLISLYDEQRILRMFRALSHCRRSHHFNASVPSKPQALAQYRHGCTTTRALNRSNQNERRKSKVNVTNLSLIPLPQLLRSIIISSICSSPTLLYISSRSLQRMLYRSKTSLWDHHYQGRLPSLLRWILKKTLYAHFCAGENRFEIRETLKNLKSLHYDGVILEYALEITASDGIEGGESNQVVDPEFISDCNAIDSWRRGMLETLDMVEPGSFVGLKSVRI